MYCDNCDAYVETSTVRDADPEHYIIEEGEKGKAKGHGWFERDEVRTVKVRDQQRGVGDIHKQFQHGDVTYDVRLLVHICKNCGVPIGARTYTMIE